MAEVSQIMKTNVLITESCSKSKRKNNVVWKCPSKLANGWKFYKESVILGGYNILS